MAHRKPLMWLHTVSLIDEPAILSGYIPPFERWFRPQQIHVTLNRNNRVYTMDGCTNQTSRGGYFTFFDHTLSRLQCLQVWKLNQLKSVIEPLIWLLTRKQTDLSSHSWLFWPLSCWLIGCVCSHNWHTQVRDKKGVSPPGVLLL